jgi:hypothetical protein
MSANVDELLEAARSLPPDQQLELLRGLAQSLGQGLSPMAPASAEFWTHRSLGEIAQRQRITAFRDTGAFAMPDWPPDESVDDLIAFVKNQRWSDRDR